MTSALRLSHSALFRQNEVRLQWWDGSYVLFITESNAERHGSCQYRSIWDQSRKYDIGRRFTNWALWIKESPVEGTNIINCWWSDYDISNAVSSRPDSGWKWPRGGLIHTIQTNWFSNKKKGRRNRKGTTDKQHVPLTQIDSHRFPFCPS